MALLLIYPWLPGIGAVVSPFHLTTVFVFSLMALGLNLQVGYAGILQLGVAAFMAVGVYVSGITGVEKFPFQWGFWAALVVAPLVTGLVGLALAVPTVRLRGDYLAIVTLGFGEIVQVFLTNFASITDGSQGLNPIPPPWWPFALSDATFAAQGGVKGVSVYYISLFALALVYGVLRVLESTGLGRALMALREDETAAQASGWNTAALRGLAFAGGAAIAGLAGALYAANIGSTVEPQNYNFPRSVMVLCCVILGGLGSLRGALLGAFLLLTYDNVFTPLMNGWVQQIIGGTSTSIFANFANWRLLVFGLLLMGMMRFRPEGLWPADAVRRELHDHEEDA